MLVTFFYSKRKRFHRKRENKGGCLNASTTRFYNDYCLYVSHYVKKDVSYRSFNGHSTSFCGDWRVWQRRRGYDARRVKTSSSVSCDAAVRHLIFRGYD